MTLSDGLDPGCMQDIFVDLLNSLSAVRDLSELNIKANSKKDLIKNALSALIQNQDMERCSFFLLDEQNRLINLTGLSSREVSTHKKKNYKPVQFKLGEGVIGVAAQTGELQHCENCREDERFTSNRQEGSTLPGSIISVPVFTADKKLVGVLNISHPEAFHFTEWHIHLLEIYKNILGQLITNFYLFQQMEMEIQQRTSKLEKALDELHKLKNHFESISMLDQLTGLYNRRYFYDQVELAIANSRRYGQPLCVLILDLDNFKKVNDDYGHQFGDIVLKDVSRALMDQVRDTDILVRFGGEEFVVIFTNTDCHNGAIFSERIRKEVESLVFQEQKSFSQTVSIGLCCVNNDNDLIIENLIHNADTALYKAKEQGRNKVITYSENMKN